MLLKFIIKFWFSNELFWFSLFFIFPNIWAPKLAFTKLFEGKLKQLLFAKFWKLLKFPKLFLTPLKLFKMLKLVRLLKLLKLFNSNQLTLLPISEFVIQFSINHSFFKIPETVFKICLHKSGWKQILTNNEIKCWKSFISKEWNKIKEQGI